MKTLFSCHSVIEFHPSHKPDSSLRPDKNHRDFAQNDTSQERLKFILLFYFLPIFLFAQTDTLQQIRILQDRRMVHSEELLSFVSSPNPKFREQALLALANIQDTSAIQEIISSLDDASPNVRSMAAFALGMLGSQQAVDSLFACLWREKEGKVVRELLNAIGRCGSINDLKFLIDNLKKISIKYKPYIAETFGRFSIRRMKDINAYPILVSMLADKNSAEQAMYALMRINDSLVANIYGDEIMVYIKHKSPQVRMWSASILGNSTVEKVKQRLVSVLKNDPDWRVRVNAVRALRNSRTELVKSAMKKAIEDKNEHVSLTAITTLDGLLLDDEMNIEQEFFKGIVTENKKYSPQQQGEAALVLGRRKEDSVVQFLSAQLDGSVEVRPYIIRALGETKSSGALNLVSPFIRHEQSLTTIVAIEAYQKIAALCDEKAQEQFLNDVLTLFKRNNAGISLTAAAAFEDTLFSKELRMRFIPKLAEAYGAMNSGNDLEPMVELLNLFAELPDSAALPAVEKGLSEQDAVIRQPAEKAYKAITGKECAVRFIKNPDEYKPFYAPDDLALLSKYKGAEITTNKGKITITFAKEAAPFTVLNFILLAQKKFYDGLTFHRVVSNFVIQGGDPLGNGSGGPGYTIRTEVHPDACYTTGAVGMASAGKDTEGSQWFITHSPTPHLDTRYTIFGYTSDSAIVDKIMVGDRIEKVTLY